MLKVLAQKMLCPKNFGLESVDPKKIGLKNIFGSKKILGPKKILILVQNFVWVQ